MEGDLECTLGDVPTLSANDNGKWLIIVEIDDTSEQVTKICNTGNQILLYGTNSGCTVTHTFSEPEGSQDGLAFVRY